MPYYWHCILDLADRYYIKTIIYLQPIYFWINTATISWFACNFKIIILDDLIHSLMYGKLSTIWILIPVYPSDRFEYIGPYIYINQVDFIGMYILTNWFELLDRYILLCLVDFFLIDMCATPTLSRSHNILSTYIWNILCQASEKFGKLFPLFHTFQDEKYTYGTIVLHTSRVDIA